MVRSCGVPLLRVNMVPFDDVYIFFNHIVPRK